MNRRHRVYFALCLLLPLVWLWRLPLLGEVLLPLDMLATAEPWHSELPSPDAPPWNPEATDAVWGLYPEAVASGRTPLSGALLWNPSVLLGTPAAATGGLYLNPVYRLTALLLPAPHAYSWTIVLQLMLLCAGAYLLLRELGAAPEPAALGAVAATFNGFVLGWAYLPNLLGAMAWQPLVLLGFERAARRGRPAWAALGAGAFAAQVLSGYVLFAVYGGVLSAVWIAYRALVGADDGRPRAWSWRTVGLGLFVLGGGGLLAAVYLVPAAELFLQSDRGAPIGGSSFLRARELVRLVAPGVRGTPLHGDAYVGPFNYVETRFYLGIAPLLLLIPALRSHRRTAAALLVALGALFLAAVYGAPGVHRVVQAVIPVFLSTFPGRILFLTAFCWAVAAGLGAQRLLRDGQDRLLAGLGALALAAAAFLAIAGLAPRAVAQLPGAAPLAVAPRPESLAITAVLCAVGGVVLLLRGLDELRGRTAAFLLLSLLIVDLRLADGGSLPSFPADRAFPETPSLRVVRDVAAASEEPVRVLPLFAGWILPGNTGMVYGLDTLTGYNSFISDRLLRYVAITGARGPSNSNQVYLTDCCSRLLDPLGAAVVYAAPDATVEDADDGLEALLAATSAEGACNSHLTSWEASGSTRPVLFAHAPCTLTLSLDRFEARRLETAAVLDPGAWDHSDGVRFRAVLRSPAGEDRVLFDRLLEPSTEPGDRRFVPVEADLPSRRGGGWQLLLSTDPGPRADAAYDWSGWAGPVLGVEEEAAAGLELLADGPNRVYRNPAALSRAWIVHDVRTVPADAPDRAAALLADPDLDPARTAVVETDAPVVTGPATGPERAVVERHAPTRVVIRTRSTAPGLLVVADQLYPGWRATVDGEERPILATDLTFRGIPLEPGEHVVELRYRPWSVLLGAVLSLLAAAALGLVALSGRRTARSEVAGITDLS